MNSRSLITVLFLSNLVLGTAVMVLVSRSHPVSPVPPPVMAVAPAESGTGLAAVSMSSPLRHYATLAPPSDWRRWIDALRDAGVPTTLLTRLVRDGFDDEWQKKQDEIAGLGGVTNADTLAMFSIEHDQELEKTMLAALGEEDFRKWDKQNVLQALNLRGIQLADTESDALYELEKKHQQQISQMLASKLKGEIDQTALEKQEATAQEDYQMQLKLLLGDRRYATMHAADGSPGDLQRSLNEIPLPASLDFETLLGIQNQWLDRRSEMTGQIQQARDQIVNSEQELKRLDDDRDQEFQRLLGTSAFDALQKAQDPNYQEIKRNASTWGNDNATTDYLYRTLKYYQKAVADYQDQNQVAAGQGQSVDWDAINQNLQQFAQQTELAVRKQLGDELFSKINNNQIFPFVQAR